MRLHTKGQAPKKRVQIARIDVVIDGDDDFAGGGIVAYRAEQRLPDMRLVYFFHLDDANLAHRDAVESDFDDAGNIALIAQKSEIVPLRRHLAHHARFARRHLADDRGKDWILAM